MRAAVVSTVAALVVGLGLVAAVMGWKASRIDPVTALKYE